MLAPRGYGDPWAAEAENQRAASVALRARPKMPGEIWGDMGRCREMQGQKGRGGDSPHAAASHRLV